jgi:glycosyltransferase involved in cell wall biosynthesis
MRKLKKKVLAWGDSPLSTTGMGKVNHEILKRIADTKEYEITFVGVHYFGNAYDKKEYPYTMVIADPDKKDMLGRFTFLSILSSQKWDIVFTHTDIVYANSVCDTILEQRDQTGFKWVCYSPIDNDQLLLEEIKSFNLADFSATYSKFGKNVITDLDKEVGDKVSAMWLGTDLDKFKPVTADEKQNLRKEIFKIEDDSTFLILNVNANRSRKDLPRTILAFKKFSDRYPNSILYIHAPQRDYGGDLEYIAKKTGISSDKIYFNPTLNSVHGIDEDRMRTIYGCADAVMSTSMAEGWGLSCTEAFACGIPTLFPRHTSLIEIIGESGERGSFIYPAPNRIFDWTIGTCWFPICDEESGRKGLEYIYNNRPNALKKAMLGREWVEEHTWDIIGSKWIEVFKELLTKKE